MEDPYFLWIITISRRHLTLIMDTSASLVIFVALVAIGSCCVNPYVKVGQKCIFFASTLHLDYQASEDICSALGGVLTKIDHPGLLWDIVKHIHNDSTLLNPYWVDGKVADNRWIYSNGVEIPHGTPYWATFLNQNQELEQQPTENNNVDSCLSIEDGSSYYFSPSACEELKSPLCEELTGEVTASNIIIKDSCGGGELTSFAGEIMSPNYPNGYPDTDGNCEWTINRGYGDSIIRITIRDMDIYGPSTPDWHYGYLQIRDGLNYSSPLLGDYWHGRGSEAPTPVELVTSGPTAWIRFYSDYDISGYRGFDLQYTTDCKSNLEGQCGGHYSSPDGVVHSPCYPIWYSYNLTCEYIITTEEGSFLTLKTVSFDTELDHDILQIRDGGAMNDPLLHSLSGSVETGFEVRSSGSQLYLSFKSDGSNQGPGFSFVWTSNELCPTPYLNVGDLCLHIIFNELTYGQSGIACKEASGELAAINDPQDLRDLYTFLHDNDIADTSFWLGGSDAEVEGLWKWNDNSLVPKGTPFWGTTGYYSEVQEPNGDVEENCLLLSSNGFHFFRDANCTTKAPAICMH